MSVGRPKEYDRIAIAKEMVEWSKNPDALTMPMFATSKGLHSGILRNWANEDKQFRALFLQAKENVGINRLKSVQNNSLNEGIYKQTMHFYDLDIKEDVREEKKFEADLKKAIEGLRQTTYILEVPPGLAIGSNIPTASISAEDNSIPKSGD